MSDLTQLEPPPALTAAFEVFAKRVEEARAARDAAQRAMEQAHDDVIRTQAEFSGAVQAGLVMLLETTEIGGWTYVASERRYVRSSAT